MPQTTLTASTLSGRALIRLSGDNVRGFLDGLITNKLAVLPAYAALLTPQGKVIADFIVWQDGGDLLLDCDAAAAEALERRLAMYRLRRAITIVREEALVPLFALRCGRPAPARARPPMARAAGGPATGWPRASPPPRCCRRRDRARRFAMARMQCRRLNA